MQVVFSNFKKHGLALKFILGYFLIIFSYTTLSNFSLHPDTADHWFWGREEIAPAYYLHPPFIAVYFRFFDFLIPNPVLALKFASVLTISLSIWFSYLGVHQIYGSLKTAKTFLLLLFSAPFFLIIGTSMNVNPLMLLFSALSFWIMGIFHRTQNPYYLLLMGVSLGVGMMSKYITIFYYVAFYAWIILTPKLHRWLKSWQIYTLPVISLIIFSPVIYANITTDFSYLKNHLNRGLGDSFGFKWNTLIDVMWVPSIFIYGPVGALLAVGLLFLLRTWKQARQDDPLFWFSIIFFLSNFGLFSYSALRKGFGDPQWYLLGFFFILVFVAKYLNSALLPRALARIKKYLLGFGLVFSLFFVGLIIMELQTHLSDRVKWVKQLTPNLVGWHIGWDDTADKITKLFDDYGVQPDIILANDRNDSGPMALYMKSHPKFHSIYREKRNPWIKEGEMEQSVVGFICRPHRCQEQFPIGEEKIAGKLELIGVVSTHHPYSGKLLRSYLVYISQRD